eukprot:GFKZ01004388.1.p2 GENE.GFKZ01004388.1~~GFKZ01004388.1.p2  ORF type:complete len:133 (+),score=32.25 GFKZ01004388.1:358-756(+)
MEGKLSIWIKSGSFNHSSDLYIQVFIDDNDVWRTDDKDGFSPDWDSTIVKHIKGDYQTITLKLMDEDTFSRDDVIATRELPISEAVEGMNGDYELFDAEGNSVGTVDVSINFEEGDVNFFDLMGSMLHKEDD